MRNVSKKQAVKNRTLAKIKSELIETSGNVCVITGNYGDDLMHLLPKSIYPEYYLEPRNLVIGSRDAHNEFDNSINFRRLQTALYEQVKEFDELAANRYFGMN